MTATLLPGGEPAKFQAKKSPQFLAALTGCIGAFGLGTALAWTSTSLSNIRDRGDLGGLTTEDESWVGSFVPLGSFFVGIVGGWMVDTFGRKMSMLLLAFPLLAGYLLIGFANGLAMVLVGRFLTGFAGGAFTMVVPIYVGEIAQNEIRGLLSNCVVLILCVGILFSYVLGTFVSWRVLAFVCAGCPVVLFAVMLFMPESPTYLLQKKKREKAIEALKWFRGAEHEYEVEAEFQQIEASVAENNAKSATFKDLLAGPILKPTSISMALMFLQQFGGINAVLFYAVDIFKSAGTDIDPNLSAIIVGAVQVGAVFASVMLVERLGRKILLIISEFGMAVSLVALGVFFYLKENNPETAKSLGWLPLTSLIVYIITYNLAMGPLPWTLMGELLPPHVKGLTSSIATATCWFLGFIISKFFSNMLVAMTAYGCYWFFAAWSFSGFLFAIFVVPETKGKSLDEIQRYFSGGKN